MAGKEQDEERDEGKPSLSPEERIAKLEKGKTLSLILIIVLFVFSTLQLAGIGYLLMAPSDTRPGENAAKLAMFEEKFLEIQKEHRESQKLYLQSKLLQEKLDKVLAEANTHNYANLRVLLAAQEQSYGDFIRSLQQGMYEISRMVRGSRTWYEVYKEDLDKILQASDARKAAIEGMK
ncbi:hypothetical protein [Motiliproteus sp. MSK22-1]|uniref:hypothetical protein n=1 Tax=Motiliproteus sp. MSK22-1 TaxID=1897630 RepID=UPI000977D21B|nr:hypothetical protein [Motiliproteus sp. MSK22-1]OMH38299.1 hypothetical protein BGP75_08630 [Motiliproteus sp. MSK22-1]